MISYRRKNNDVLVFENVEYKERCGVGVLCGYG